ncbi:radical SAM family heme chaperone HemW [Chloroflexota bacterium]
MEALEPLSIYFHIPFCKRRCGYCDFNTFSGMDSLIPDYFESLRTELIEVSNYFNNKPKVYTLFFGGGTPSIIPIQEYEKLFDTINELFSVELDSEISMEINPGTITVDYLAGLRQLGVNRLSIGAQSMDDSELKLLERIHNREEVIDSIKNARKAYFDNINIDLIYGLPYQEMTTWNKSLNEIKAIYPEHISLYALTIEKDTPFYEYVLNKEMAVPNVDTAADMFEWSRSELAKSGYYHYEISNWAKCDFECVHNKQYWYNNNYLGIGAGAHSHYNNRRYSNVNGIKEYIQMINKGKSTEKSSKMIFPYSSAKNSLHFQKKNERMQESMMLGLRLTEEGVSVKTFRKRFGKDMKRVFINEIDELIEKKLVEWNQDSLRLTQRGQTIGNQVFLKFI